MEAIKVHQLTPEKGNIVGFAIVAHRAINKSQPALVGNDEDSLEVPLRFYGGDLGAIRAELHIAIDEAIDALY